jgi:hypothetical protein
MSHLRNTSVLYTKHAEGCDVRGLQPDYPSLSSGALKKVKMSPVSLQAFKHMACGVLLRQTVTG